MPTIEENERIFDKRSNWSQHWPQEGQVWSTAWGPEPRWFGIIFPRIHIFVPTGTILEITPGFERWTHYLKDYFEHLKVVDLAEGVSKPARKGFHPTRTLPTMLMMGDH